MSPAIPEIYLAFAICVVLLFDAFVGVKRPSATSTLTLVVLVIGAALTVRYANVGHHQVLFDGMYVADPLAFVLKLAGFLFVAVALLYSRMYLENRDILRGEYYVLALTALLGVFVLVSANSLLTVYIGVELLALSVYAMVAFDRDSGIAAESAMKYFVLGAIASGTLLYGMSIVYGMTGTLDLEVIATKLTTPGSMGVVLGLAFIVVAVAFKFGAVPFHMWLPDVYEGAPTSVTLFVGTVPKIAYFALTLRLLAHGLAGTSADWTVMLMPLAVLSLIVGNVVAIAQSDLKRMLAYSTIGHVGFIVLGFVAGTPSGYTAALYYMLVYVLMALGAFGVILLAGRKGFEADKLDGADVLLRRRTPSGRLLGEAQDHPGAVGNEPPRPGGHLGADVGGRRFLLSARREAHVLRCAAGGPAGHAAAARRALRDRGQCRGSAGARRPAESAARSVQQPDPLMDLSPKQNT